MNIFKLKSNSVNFEDDDDNYDDGDDEIFLNESKIGKNKTFIKRLFNKKIKTNYLNLDKLERPFRDFIRSLFKNLLVLQASLFGQKKSLKLFSTNLIDENQNKKTSNSLSSILNCKSDNKSTKKIKLSEIDSNNFIQELDKFSSILLNINNKTSTLHKTDSKSDIDFLENIGYLTDSEMNQNQKETQPGLTNVKETAFKMLKRQGFDDLYAKNINSIQKEMMGEWNSINGVEKLGINNLFLRWQTTVSNIYKSLPAKHKQIRTLSLNEEKLIKKGQFDFENNEYRLKKIQLELLNLSCCERKDLHDAKKKNAIIYNCSINTPQSKIRPNTRLLLRSYKQFLDVFDCLSQSKKFLFQEPADLKSYWGCMNRSMIHMSKAILRCGIYVYQNANLQKASIGLPPIYILESDDCKSLEVPYLKFDKLYELILICQNQLIVNIQNQKNICYNLTLKNAPHSSLSVYSQILSHYKLVLNCLMRLIQMGSFMRDTLMMKKIIYDQNSNENKVCDVDIYSHFISNECCLIREYLKNILELSFN